MSAHYDYKVDRSAETFRINVSALPGAVAMSESVSVAVIVLQSQAVDQTVVYNLSKYADCFFTRRFSAKFSDRRNAIVNYRHDFRRDVDIGVWNRLQNSE